MDFKEIKENFIIGMAITLVFSLLFWLFILVYDGFFADYKILKSSNYVCSFQSSRSETRVYNTVSTDSAGRSVVGIESQVDHYYLYKCLESENKKISFNKEFSYKYPSIIYLKEDTVYIFGFLSEYVSTKEYVTY